MAAKLWLTAEPEVPPPVTAAQTLASHVTIPNIFGTESGTVWDHSSAPELTGDCAAIFVQGNRWQQMHLKKKFVVRCDSFDVAALCVCHLGIEHHSSSSWCLVAVSGWNYSFIPPQRAFFFSFYTNTVRILSKNRRVRKKHQLSH